VILFYLPPNEFWYHTVARLDVSFNDGKSGTGTGFFVYDDEHYFLVTARHVVDPTYLPPAKKREAICTEMVMAFQSAVNSGTQEASGAYQSISVSKPVFCFESNDVDVAVTKIPKTALPI